MEAVVANWRLGLIGVRGSGGRSCDSESGVWERFGVGGRRRGRPSKKQLLWAIRYHGVLERSKRKPASLQCLYAKNQEQKHRGKAQKYIDRSGSN